MAWCPFNVKQVREQILIYCQFNRCGEIFIKYKFKGDNSAHYLVILSSAYKRTMSLKVNLEIKFVIDYGLFHQASDHLKCHNLQSCMDIKLVLIKRPYHAMFHVKMHMIWIIKHQWI